MFCISQEEDSGPVLHDLCVVRSKDRHLDALHHLPGMGTECNEKESVLSLYRLLVQHLLVSSCILPSLSHNEARLLCLWWISDINKVSLVTLDLPVIT